MIFLSIFACLFIRYILFESFYLGIFGGYLLGVRTSSGLSFYDWETLDLVRRIEVQPRYVVINVLSEYIEVLIS